MQALLIRVGVDSGNGGALGPIYDDGTFDFVPIPERRESSETRTYSDIEGVHGNLFSEHVDDEHANDVIHSDPEFETYTYGDPNKREQLLQLSEDDYLIFYAGLQPAEYDDAPRLFVIGYFTVAEVHDPEEMPEVERSALFERLENNAHTKRVKTTPESKHPENDNYPVIVEGKPSKSELLEKARPLSDGYLSPTNPRYYMLDSVAKVTGYSANKDLTRSSGRWLEPDDGQSLKSWLDGEIDSWMDEATAVWSYVLKHDSGFAPNTSHGYCTLATCKPKIRKNAEIGDWVIGTGSITQNDPEERLLYAMRVDEIFSYQEYFEDPRYENKKPLAGDLYDANGDNIYYPGAPLSGDEIELDEEFEFELPTPNGNVIYFSTGSEFIQLENPHHGPARIKKDTPKNTDRQAVLVSRQYWYFGDKDVRFPKNEGLRHNLIKSYTNPNGKIGSTKSTDSDHISQFLEWLITNHRIGKHRPPRDTGESDPDHDHTHTDC